MPTSAIRVPLVRARLDRLDDGRLAALAGAGEERAFEALYDRHHRALLGFCRHLLGSRDEAEDALQQTFLRAHRALEARGAPDELRPWLFTIARNRCKTMLAARRPDATGDEEAEPSTEGLGSEVERRADLRVLLGDLRRLPEDQRSALVLAELADLPHAEIAAVIGVPAAKVKALVHQARSRLIAERDARETPCERIREQLATARGGELRRGPLRRHLRSCEACRAYGTAVADQRAALGLLLPVLPSAGLKEAVLGAAAGGGGGGTAAAVGAAATGTTAGSGGAGVGSGGGLGLAAKGLGTKLAVGAALAGGAGAGAVAVDRAVSEPPPRSAPRVATVRPEAPPARAVTGEPVLASAGAAGSEPEFRGSSRAEGERGSRAGQRRAGSRRKSRGRKGPKTGSPGRSGESNGRGAERAAGAPGRLKAPGEPATGRGRSAAGGPPKAAPAPRAPASTPPGQTRRAYTPAGAKEPEPVKDEPERAVAPVVEPPAVETPPAEADRRTPAAAPQP